MTSKDDRISQEQLDDFEHWLGSRLRNLQSSLRPNTDTILALIAGALRPDQARYVREQLRRSPEGLKDYARIAGVSLAEAQAELNVDPNIVEILQGMVAAAHETISRTAWLISHSTAMEPIRGEERGEEQGEHDAGMTDTRIYRAPDDPPATVSVSASRISAQRYKVTGTIAFDDQTQIVRGHFILSQESGPISGEVSEGEFDLGVLSQGQYQLELIVESHLIAIRPLDVGV